MRTDILSSARASLPLAVVSALLAVSAALIGLAGVPQARAVASSVDRTKARPRHERPRFAHSVVHAASEASEEIVDRIERERPVKPVRARRVDNLRTAGRGPWRLARASWYGPGFYGRTMAGGGRLRPDSLVVAHRTLRFGTKVLVSYNGRSVVAVVRDRGPYVRGRTFDLGPGTAKRLGFRGVGLIRYRIL